MKYVVSVLYMLVPCFVIPFAVWNEKSEASAALAIQNYKKHIREILIAAFSIGAIAVIDIHAADKVSNELKILGLTLLPTITFCLINYVRYSRWSSAEGDTSESKEVLAKLDNWVVWAAFLCLVWSLVVMLFQRHW